MSFQLKPNRKETENKTIKIERLSTRKKYLGEFLTMGRC